MKLYYSKTSPFARKVTQFLHFTGLIHECELSLTTFESDELREKNPLGKIPALMDGDICLFESELILEYLDDKYSLDGHLSLINRGSQKYYSERKAAAQSDGILEAAVNSMFESKRTTEKSDYWLNRWNDAMTVGLQTLALEHCGSAEKPNATTFNLAATLGYLDFRHPTFSWRDIRGDIDEWFQHIQACDWFIQTAPPQQ